RAGGGSFAGRTCGRCYGCDVCRACPYSATRLDRVSSGCSAGDRGRHSFPTRRSSDLFSAFVQRKFSMPNTERHLLWRSLRGQTKDRKSTRLNSSHVSISYAVFCSKKKKLVSSTTVRHNVTSVRIEVLTDR